MNTILIKHGSDAPSKGTLQNYELGYVDNGALYIGYNNQSVKLTDPRLLNLLDSDGYLDIPNLPAAGKAQTKVLVANDNNVVYSRTPAQIRSDIGAFASSGGTVSGATTFNSTVTVKGKLTVNNPVTISGLLTANGAIVVDEDSYGDKDPNTAGTNGAALPGTTGQLYFVWCNKDRSNNK